MKLILSNFHFRQIIGW